MGYKTVARIARRQAYRIQETKEVTYGPSTGNFGSFNYGASSALVGCFGSIANGTLENQRIGNRIFARGVYIYFAMQPGDNSNDVRLLVVQPTRSAGATPIPASQTATFVNSVMSNSASNSQQYLQPVDTDRWTVLYDKCFNLRYLPLGGSSADTVPQTKIIRKYIKVNRTLQWDDTGNMNNDVYIIGLSNSAAIPNPGNVAGFIKSYFKDI